MLKLTKHIETVAVFWRKAYNALKTIELMGGVKAFSQFRQSVATLLFLLNQLTTCPSAWGVVVCTGAAHNAPAASMMTPFQRKRTIIHS